MEAVVNAVIHRSYSVSGDHVRIEVFDDRVEVESPGRFPGVAQGDDPLRVTRFARNPRIARVLSDLRYGQELGEGIRRMFEEMRLAGLRPPAYRQTSGSVVVALGFEHADQETEDRLPAGASDVLRLVRRAGSARTGDLVTASGRSRPVVIRHLRALQAEGLIEWRGESEKDPRARWVAR